MLGCAVPKAFFTSHGIAVIFGIIGKTYPPCVLVPQDDPRVCDVCSSPESGRHHGAELLARFPAGYALTLLSSSPSMESIAWIAAHGTASSGLIDDMGTPPEIFSTIPRTIGMRVMPPTIRIFVDITPSHPGFLQHDFADGLALLHQGEASCSKSSRVSSILMLLPLKLCTRVVRGRLESWILAASARLCSSW